ncbi:hypothetical protein Bcp1_129 [Bacillus phage Bcp1]|uniref:Uncharacterized protein n=1 Tax=Bacillus phage Bcp1 TaxID=584892 RepID=X2JIU7_9CAUD|nr:hypothetical protein Bcp1_129 [Bacillus phage Bcp1]AHN66604.1 hypothetical protein Bcp1_129 [Bacillus phage Bcp1]
MGHRKWQEEIGRGEI